MSVAETEAWQRGPVEGYAPLLMPVVHALIQVREDLERLASDLSTDDLWARPGGAASIGFHLRHTGGALDRLFTYARGEVLNDSQRAWLRAEGDPGPSPPSAQYLVCEVGAVIERALAQLRTTDVETVLDVRRVGRAGLPSTVLGLLFHAAEHSTRHIGQAITTAKILRGSQPGASS